jgi:glycosyltransferase involved in cell wall biosynthesis
VRILVIADCIPFPPIGGGELRTHYLLRALATRHQVTLVGFVTREGTTPPPFPVRVVAVPWDWPPLYRQMLYGDEAASQAAYEVLEYGSDVPWCANWAQSEQMAEAVVTLVKEPFDLVLIEHSYMAGLLPTLPPATPRVLDFVDLHALMAQRAAGGGDHPDEEPRAKREAERTLRFEQRAAAHCGCSLAVSEREATAAQALLGARQVEVIPNGVDTSFFVPAGGPSTPGYLLYAGTMNYGPNVEAVEYFVSQILPLLQRNAPDVEFHIVGARPMEPVLRLAAERVIVHGQVPDIRPSYQRASAVVVPLLRGGGTRLKILEAGACARAIVSTALGAEGLEFVDGRDLLIADSTPEFADGILRLLRDPRLRDRLGRSARQASERYDWEHIGSQLCAIVERMGQRAA